MKIQVKSQVKMEKNQMIKKDCDGICACSYKSINLISKNSKTPLNIHIHNYVPLINSIYF